MNLKTDANGQVQCAYFALCVNIATGYVDNTILGPVPSCEHCANAVGAEFHTARIELTEDSQT